MLRNFLPLAAIMVWAGAGAAQPSAHSPDYTNKKSWPLLTGKEHFVQEKWQQARILVWANPGRHGGAPAGGAGGAGRGKPITVPPGTLDPADPKHWLEDGKPAAAPPDKDTDVVVPEAAQEYTVNLVAARHITVGQNATVIVPRLVGNLWIKPGGRVYSTGRSARIEGDKHTFIRNDNLPLDPAAKRDLPGRKADWRMSIGYDILVQKYKNASVEFLGVIWAGDELVVWEGTAIVGPDSVLRPGRPSTTVIGTEASLIMMSGSYFGKQGCGGGPVDIHVKGRVLAGTPERPLTKDARLGVSCPHIYTDNRGDHQHGQYGLLIEPAAELRVHSSDPAKARLILKWNEGGSASANKEKINLTLLGKLDLNGVVFDQVAKGGIKLPELAQRAQWKNVFFTERNEGKPDELFMTFTEAVPKMNSQGVGFIKKK